MRIVKYTIILSLILVVGGFLHYTLPRHEVVRIVESETRRVEFQGIANWFFSNSEPADPAVGSRDVRFISAIRPDGRSIVYRNEDTGFGWPPYFKFDSSDVQADAADMISNTDNPKWALVTRYGWRNQFISIYPNVVEVQPVAGPEVVNIPWFNIFFLAGLVLLCLWASIRLRRFWKRRIDPVAANVERAFERTDDHMDAQRAMARTRMQRLREWWVERFG